MDDASIPKVQPVRPELYTGDLGSQVLTLKTDNARDLLNLVECFEGGFRKFWYDLVGGIAEFMSPTPRPRIHVARCPGHHSGTLSR